MGDDRQIKTGQVQIAREDVLISHETVVVVWPEDERLPEMNGPTIVVHFSGHFPEESGNGKVQRGSLGLDAYRARGLVAQIYAGLELAGVDMAELRQQINADLHTVRARWAGDHN